MTRQIATAHGGLGEPRSVADVVRDVSRWQADIIFGKQPGPTPIGESGYPLTHMAARTYFGVDVMVPASDDSDVFVCLPHAPCETPAVRAGVLSRPVPVALTT